MRVQREEVNECMVERKGLFDQENSVEIRNSGDFLRWTSSGEVMDSRVRGYRQGSRIIIRIIYGIIWRNL